MQLQVQISHLSLTSELGYQGPISEASSENGIRSRQSSPEKWQQFSSDPRVHDDAIRNAMIQDKVTHRRSSPVKIKETFIPVSTGNGYRHVPSNHARLDRWESTFGKTAIGYGETQGVIRPGSGEIQGDRQRPSPVNTPVARSTRHLQEFVRMNSNQIDSGRHEVVSSDETFAGVDNQSILTAIGFEAEVLGQRSAPPVAGHSARVLAHDNDKSLINVAAAADTGDGASAVRAINSNVKGEVEKEEGEEPVLIIF